MGLSLHYVPDDKTTLFLLSRSYHALGSQFINKEPLFLIIFYTPFSHRTEMEAISRRIIAIELEHARQIRIQTAVKFETVILKRK